MVVHTGLGSVRRLPVVLFELLVIAAFLSPHTERTAFGATPFSKEKAFEAIVRPPDPVPFWGDRLAGSLLPCYLHLVYLSEAPGDTENQLLALTGEDHLLEVRFRATVALLMRNSDQGLKIAARWAKSGEEIDRLMAWLGMVYYPRSVAPADKFLPGATAVALYRKETNKNVRKLMVSWFGRARVREAVDALCVDAANPRDTGEAVDALGLIGDPRAVDAIVRAPCHIVFRFEALRRIGGREAVDFLIKNIDQPPAPYVLAEAGDRRAVPFLRARMDQLVKEKRSAEQKAAAKQPGDKKDGLELDIRRVRLALLTLESADPNDALLTVVENH